MSDIKELEGSNPTKDIKELEALYEQRKQEFLEKSKLQSRLQGEQDGNIREMSQKLGTLSPSIIKMFGLTLDKPIETLSVEELKAFRDKVQTAYNGIYGKLQQYLQTGKFETIAELVATQNSIDDSNQEVGQVVQLESINDLYARG